MNEEETAVRRFRWLLAAALPLLATFWLISASVLVRNFHHSKAYGWTMTVDGDRWEFATVDADGPAAGDSSSPAIGCWL